MDLVDFQGKFPLNITSDWRQINAFITDFISSIQFNS